MKRFKTGKSRGFGAMLLLITIMLCGRQSNAHKIQMFTSGGCITTGQTISIDAIVTDAPASTHYNWQFKGTNGTWICFTNGSNTINGQPFTVTGAVATGPANNAPQLNILNGSTVLDNLSIRCLMRENASPCGAPAGTVYGGDDLNTNEVKTLRLRLAADPAACGISCASNVLNNTNGYYGGFEAVSYVSSNTFSDKNFVVGAGSSELTVNGGGTGSFKVMNNPFAAYNTFAKFAPHSGNYQMIVKGNTEALSKVWYKTITVIPGETYSFSVWASKADNAVPKIQLKANGTEIASALLPSVNGVWQQLNSTYTVPSGITSVTFSIHDKNAATAAHNYVLDDICLVKTNEGITIGDRVWFDVNRNGAQDTGEPGINAVTAKLYYDGNGDNNADSVNPVQISMTDSNGAYSFKHVIAGKYFVLFTVPAGYTGFTTQNATGVPVGQNSAVNPATGKTGTHDFTADFLTKDAGLVKNYSISGKVFMDVNGLTDNTVNGTLISTVSGAALYANLFAGNSFVSAVAVSNGLYSFSNLNNNTSYKVAISDIQATATSTPASVLPAGWLNTGEHLGAGTGNDDLADGLLTINISNSNIADAIFGMQQRPHAGVSTTTAQINPGAALSIAVPAATFLSSDVNPGVVSAFKIISFPSNATSITIATNTYYVATAGIPPVCPTATCSVFPVQGVTVTAPSGVPSGAVKIDPLNGAVTVRLPFTAVDNGNAASSDTGIAIIPFVVPDLTPNITATPNVLHGATTFNVTVAVSEIKNVATQGTITVYIPKDSRVTFTFNQGLNAIGTSPVIPLNNSIWTYNGTDNFYHIFTTNNVITANSFSTFGFVASFNPGNTRGKYPVTATIISGSGKEDNTTNNNDSEILSYFSN